MKALRVAGFRMVRQVGSHCIMHHPSQSRLVVIPMHRGDMKRGLLFGIIKSAGLSPDDFLKLL